MRDSRRISWQQLATRASTACASLLARLRDLRPSPAQAARHGASPAAGPTAAARTPTSSNVQLLATLAAREFGWLGLHEFAERLAGVLDEITRRAMEEHPLQRRPLRTPGLPLEEPFSPRDGDLAVQLHTLQQACLALRTSPLLSPRALHAPCETLALVREALDAEAEAGRLLVTRHALARCTLSRVEQELRGDVPTLVEAGARLRRAFDLVGELMDNGEDWLPGMAYRGLARIRRDIASHLHDLGLALAMPASACIQLAPPARLPADATLATLAAAHRASGNARAALAIEELSRCLARLAGRCECLSQEFSPG